MSIERYSRSRQIQLGKSLANKRKIYLDVCYWIVLRDASLGVRDDAAALQLLDYLSCGVCSGQLLCPISAAVFLELMKQPYAQDRRLGTAQLIDKLSLGVTMIPPPILMATEVYSFLLNAISSSDLHPMQELIWTKVSNILGDVYPSLAQLSPSEEFSLQKSFFDHLWDYSLSDMVKTIGDKFPPADRYCRLSQETNEKNEQYKHDLISFAQTYDTELRGVIEIAGDMAADAIEDLAQQQAGQELSPTPKERQNTVNVCCNLLYHAFKKPETKNALRALHIGASIHASMRWDKKRKFKANDYYDFEHATAALGYCDAFLTEKPLREIIKRPHLKLETINSCHVISDIDAAVDYVRRQIST